MSTRPEREDRRRGSASTTGQAELAGAIQQGVRAWRAGDDEGATSLLGRAVELASEAGDDDRLAQLGALVTIEDGATGKVAMRPDASNLAAMVVDTRSTTKTVRHAPPAEPGDP